MVYVGSAQDITTPAAATTWQQRHGPLPNARTAVVRRRPDDQPSRITTAWGINVSSASATRYHGMYGARFTAAAAVVLLVVELFAPSSISICTEIIVEGKAWYRKHSFFTASRNGGARLARGTKRSSGSVSTDCRRTCTSHTQPQPDPHPCPCLTRDACPLCSAMLNGMAAGDWRKFCGARA